MVDGQNTIIFTTANDDGGENLTTHYISRRAIEYVENNDETGVTVFLASGKTINFKGVDAQEFLEEYADKGLKY